jgi:methionyl-tRNA formyltransferase
VVAVARLVYLGTPELAVPPLRALADAGHDVALAVTGPDRRRGRGGASSPTPVKAAATELGIPTTDRIGDLLDLAEGPELGVVVAYGRLIRPPILVAVPMVNLHFSLLPRWRGAAPVERAILAGDTETGVCVMAVEEGLDTGALYASEVVDIGPNEHLATLRDRLVERGTALLVDVVRDGVAGLPEPVPQEGEATYATKIDPVELVIDWTRSTEEILRVVRLDRAHTSVDGRRLRVLEATADPAPAPGLLALPPGSLSGEVVRAGEGAVRLVVVQPEGSRPMAAADWRRGSHLPDPVMVGAT